MSQRSVPSKLRVATSVLVFRHGDRSPAINFFAKEQSAAPTLAEKQRQEEELQKSGGSKGPETPESIEEIEAWSNRLPTLEELDKYNEQFPVLHVDGMHDAHAVVQEAPTPSSIDNREDPFGKLTRRGMSQLHANGVALRKRFDTPLKPEEVQLFSSDYTRTHQSAQCLLRGLFDLDSADLGSRKDVRVPVLVPPRALNVANSWEAKPRLRELVASSVTTDSFFTEVEKEHEEAREKLIANLPYYQENPEEFFWIYVCDYYVTREAHGLPIDPNVENVRDSTLSANLKRFLRWYMDEAISDLAAGDLLRAVHSHMERALTGDENTKRLLCFSGHDITLLPVLCALGFREGAENDADFDKHWPPYASTLLFELLVADEPTPTSSSGSSVEDSGEDDTAAAFVRVVYNDEVLAGPEPIDRFWAERPIFGLKPNQAGGGHL
ncbi:Acid phosphatase, putative [Hondaea fermentalgiana]|uniref:Acid phosphatase, putative n=1 Tax=Hondaea fermentalgiana TaxID=2315210 RepID=A0A2R5GAM8_9STRA|nr:Acid phosphatase, putative [Hondaea fermentalgiana]|eukprot:GBG26798.1 Acid phosphatase, putative [Hondaea fermentalgiana]